MSETKGILATAITLSLCVLAVVGIYYYTQRGKSVDGKKVSPQEVQVPNAGGESTCKSQESAPVMVKTCSAGVGNGNERENRIKVKTFIDEELARARNTSEAILILDVFYSRHGNVPGMDDAVKVVHDRVGKEFRKLCVGPENASDEGGGRFRQLGELIERVMKSKAFEDSKSYWRKFAEECLKRGQMHKGEEGAFVQEYEITRIDAQISYKRVEGVNKLEFPVNFKGVAIGFDAVDTKWEASRILNRDDNNKFITVWEGQRVLKGTPWHAARLSFRVTDMNRFTKNISAEYYIDFTSGGAIVLEEGQYLQVCGDLKTERNSGDKHPSVILRLYVKGKGEDLQSLLPPDD